MNTSVQAQMTNLAALGIGTAPTGGGPQPYTLGPNVWGANIMPGVQMFGMQSVTAGFGLQNMGIGGKLLNATSNTISSKTGGNGLKAFVQNALKGFGEAAQKSNAELSQNSAAASNQVMQAAAQIGQQLAMSSGVTMGSGGPGGMPAASFAKGGGPALMDV